ncbi:MAG: CPBP family intramembrane metalloprotease [Gammaproteobacteria bacterium]|nr:CPBP family intramembrane metalloprotease [Gammaproteobacteria bacterium]
MFDGALPADYAQAAQAVPVWVAATGGIGFLVVNGLVEDMVFFGLLLTVASRALGRAAIPLVAVFFGIAHLGGVPSGTVGAVLAGCWGLILAFLRHRTGGMLATYLAHIVADATIIAVLLPPALAT